MEHRFMRLAGYRETGGDGLIGLEWGKRLVHLDTQLVLSKNNRYKQISYRIQEGMTFNRLHHN